MTGWPFFLVGTEARPKEPTGRIFLHPKNLADRRKPLYTFHWCRTTARQAIDKAIPEEPQVRMKDAVPPRRHNSFLLIVLAITAFAFLSCSGRSDPSGKLLVYTSVPESFIAKICEEFSKTNKKIKVTYFRSASEAVITKFKAETASGSPSADVLWVADFALGEGLKKAGLLSRYESPEASGILPLLKDPDGYYCAARLLSMVLAYNTDSLFNPPHSYDDLLRPDYRGKIGIADPGQSGASLYAITALVKSPNFGLGFLKALCENGLVVVKDNESLMNSLLDGSLRLGLGLDYLVRSENLAKSGAVLEYAIPEEGAILIPSPIALTANADNSGAAKAFIDYILSRNGQRLISSQGVAPIRLDVIPPRGISTITQMRILAADPKEILAAEDDVIKAFREFIQR